MDTAGAGDMHAEFTSYGWGTWHCRVCHRAVRTWDFDDPDDVAAVLAGHLAFNCRDDPGAVLAAGR